MVQEVVLLIEGLVAIVIAASKDCNLTFGEWIRHLKDEESVSSRQLLGFKLLG